MASPGTRRDENKRFEECRKEEATILKEEIRASVNIEHLTVNRNDVTILNKDLDRRSFGTYTLDIIKALM